MDKNKVQVHNKEEEKSVGFFNHDISICGKLNADCFYKNGVQHIS